MIKSNNYFPRIIKEICNELDINYEFLSKDWIIKLSKDEPDLLVGINLIY